MLRSFKVHSAVGFVSEPQVRKRSKFRIKEVPRIPNWHQPCYRHLSIHYAKDHEQEGKLCQMMALREAEWRSA